MKRSIFLFAGAALMLFGACQDNKVMYEYDSSSEGSAYIDFSNYVGGITRSSMKTGASFAAGDAMGVFGSQTMGDILSYPFNNQLVTNVSTASDPNLWSYEPKKYWDINSQYDFYAIYPYSASDYTFDRDSRLFTVNDFIVKSAADDQVDLMIAQSVINARPFNKVNFVFNHILSNVNFYVKTSDEFDVNGITSVTVLSFDITGLYGKGSYAQTEWNGNNSPVGVWTADNTSVYDLPEVKDVSYVIGGDKSSLAEDLLLLPQNISDDAMVNVTYKLNYANGDESVFRRSVSLNRIMGVKRSALMDTVAIASWASNYRYNYTISIDPSVTDQGGHHLPIADPDHDQQDHQDNPGVYPPTVDLLPVDTDGDGVDDDYWVDEDMDGTPDYPLVWADIDGDGKEEAMPDRDSDGQPDDSDGDGNPDVIWMDTDSDGIVDTELERPLTPSGPDIPDTPAKTPFADYNGGIDDYMYADSYLMTDDQGEYWIDLDGDGNGDIHILWKDIDGDGLLEGIADKNGDGLLTDADSYDNDGKDYLGNN
ncbi:MAG: fimbrillin family protein, partial [Bacteroidaceae bacterium]|nr:fimbrillin family protein [Bacteroidaceae bacterium]